MWPLLLMAVIFVASSRTTIAGPEVVGADKVAHFTVYAWLGVLLVRWPAVAALRPLGVWSAVAIASLYGISDEVHQSFTPGRAVELADWAADTIGAFVAVAVYTRWTGFRRWLESAPRQRAR